MCLSFARHIVRRTLRGTASAVVSAACLAGMLVTANTAHAQGLYQPPASTQPTGVTPQGVAAADFARSGFQGLAVTNNTSNNLKVYVATGPGTFASAATYATCKKPTAVLAQDLTGDGYPDIIVLCPTSNTADLFVNNGDGTFASAAPYTVSDPVAVAVGNFANTNTLGIAVASGTGSIEIYLDIAGNLVTHTINGTGTFSGIVTGDFNHDGNLDLAVSDSANNTVHTFNGDGTGNFTAAGTFTAGTSPSGLATADFNNDGNLDLAVTNADSNNVSMLLGSASGTFTTQANPQAAGLNPVAISVTDVNSDGYPDVIAYDAQNATSTAQNAYVVLLGNGDGTLQTPQTSSLSSTPGTVAAVADFNRDGKPDLAITLQTSNTVTLLLNNTLPTPYPGGRSYAAYSAVSAGNGNMADSVATGDFNRDGQLDVAVSYLEDNAVSVLLNNGGSFQLGASYPVGQQPYSVVSADVNGDGFPDLVTANTSLNSPTGTVSVLLNNRNGTFAAAATYTVGRLPYQVAVGDVNGDGYPDLAVTNYGANTVSVLYGSKAGTFTTGPTLTTGTNPYGVAIGDFQHNGRPGIAVTCYATSQLYVFPNNGNGTFGTPYIYSTDVHPTSLVTGDFNRDNKLDIVTGNSTANDLSFFAGQGNGSFAAGVTSPSLNFPDSIATGDINGDGILDIVAVAPNFNKVAVALGIGDGTFGTFQERSQGEFNAVKQPWAVALGDFNNDGQLDIVTANTYNQVNITIPAYQTRYMTQYPPVSGGVPSVDVLSNQSAATIFLTVSPAPPIPANNTGVTLTASVQPALSGGTPTGSVTFEDASGAPYGPGPYTLSNGTATADTGRLGSGQYMFTTLYSGDTTFQPTTASGAGFAVTVAGTPVALTLNPSTVQYAQTFAASVSVTGTQALGAPQGTVTIYGVSGGTTFTLGTITLSASGNNGTGTGTYTAVGPNLNVGNYQLYGYFTPSNGSYQPGSSSNVLLTVTGEPTTISLSCGFGILSSTCTATVDATTTNTPAPSGTIVNFTGPAGDVSSTVGANGKATYSFGEVLGIFTVTATFPAQSNYLASPTASQTGGCIIICFGERNGGPIALNSFSGTGLNGNFTALSGGTSAPSTRQTALFPLF